jgi:predicted anti-sigma-YlaC factor YlaD
MYKCRDIANHASDYVDGQVTRRQRLAFAWHLLICGHCREFLRQLRLSLRFYQRLPTQELTTAEAEAVVRKALNTD